MYGVEWGKSEDSLKGLPITIQKLVLPDKTV